MTQSVWKYKLKSRGFRPIADKLLFQWKVLKIRKRHENQANGKKYVCFFWSTSCLLLLKGKVSQVNNQILQYITLKHAKAEFLKFLKPPNILAEIYFFLSRWAIVARSFDIFHKLSMFFVNFSWILEISLNVYSKCTP